MFGFGGKGDKTQPTGQGEPVDPKEVVAAFPRGLSDGDRNKPVAIGRWPSAKEIGRLLTPWEPWQPGKPAMLLLGKDHLGRYYGHADDRHVLTVAGSRAGKGISLIVPNLCYWPGSVIAIDPKGELATLTASRRSAEGSDWSAPLTPGEGEVYALDPFGRVTGPAKQFAQAAYNPMANLDPTTGPGQDLAYQIADSLIVQSEGDGAHWTQAARSLLRGIILYAAAKEEPASRNLITVRRLLTGGDAAKGVLWERMRDFKKDEEAYDLIRRMGETMLGRGQKENGSIVSSAEVQTAFLEGPEMKRVLSNSSFELESLKDRRLTIYLCLPATRLDTHGRWLKMIVSLAMDAMERTGPLKQDKPPVLFALDEFAVLGRMPMVEKAAGQIASFGVKLWPIVQDITQLKRDYQESWETFMGNAGILTFHGNTDLTTTQAISDRLGQTETLRTVMQASQTYNEKTGAGVADAAAAFMSGGGQVPTIGEETASRGLNKNQNLQIGPLMQPSEVVRFFAREENNVLVMIPNKGPVALFRARYYHEDDDATFGGLIDPVEGQPKPRTNRAQRVERDRRR